MGLLSSTLIGTMMAFDVRDFVFRYLFVGANFALMGSVLYHRFHGNSHDKETRKSGSRIEVEEAKEKFEARGW
jgi:hypothetical protein